MPRMEAVVVLQADTYAELADALARIDADPVVSDWNAQPVYKRVWRALQVKHGIPIQNAPFEGVIKTSRLRA